MRIHTNHAAEVIQAVHNATRQMPGVYATLTGHGSRKRLGAIELSLEGNSGRYKNSGQYGAAPEMAATWDEWGAVFAAIFTADPDATCYNYDGAEDYHHQTGDRFRNGMPAEPHANHRFADYDRETGTHTCKCGAVRRQALSHQA